MGIIKSHLIKNITIMGKVICPYCFEQFDSKDVMFRCGNVGRCKQEEDSVLSKYWATKQIVGATIESSGGLFGLKLSTPDSAKCPKCGEKSYQMICPHCHNRVPREMVKKKGFIISIIGARSSGKTVYITTLINELQRHGRLKLDGLGIQADNVAEDPANNTQNRYERDFFNVLYRDKKCPAQTDINAPESKIPLIYEITKEKGDNIYLVFYDTAGENFANINNIKGNVKFLQESDATIFLLDTFNVPYVHDKLGLKGDINLRYNVIIDNVLTFFKESMSPEVRDAHFKKPMALVFGKIDAILNNADTFADTSIPGMSMESDSSYLQGCGVSLDEFDGISASLEGALEAWDEGNFIQVIRNNYKNAKYFGISALGEDPVSNSVQKVKPFRVLDPLVWILSEFKFPLPITK